MALPPNKRSWLRNEQMYRNLKQFFGRVQNNLTATIYEWDVNHVSDALEAAMRSPGIDLSNGRQRSPRSSL